MTKREEIFEELKTIILALKNKGDTIQKDKQLIDRFTERVENVGINIEALSQEDFDWLSGEYNKWIKKMVGEDFEKNILTFG